MLFRRTTFLILQVFTYMCKLQSGMQFKYYLNVLFFRPISLSKQCRIYVNKHSHLPGANPNGNCQLSVLNKVCNV